MARNRDGTPHTHGGTDAPECMTCSNLEPPAAPPLCECGWPADTFPCRIRHQHLNTGAAKAAND